MENVPNAENLPDLSLLSEDFASDASENESWLEKETEKALLRMQEQSDTLAESELKARQERIHPTATMMQGLYPHLIEERRLMTREEIQERYTSGIDPIKSSQSDVTVKTSQIQVGPDDVKTEMVLNPLFHDPESPYLSDPLNEQPKNESTQSSEEST